MNNCKIYLLTNKKNGKVYVGQTWNELKNRMGKTGEGYSNSPYLYHAIKYYGPEHFEYSLLDEADNQTDADRLEDEYIVKYNSRDLSIGYNLKQGGSHGKHSEETKKKISESLLAKEWSTEAIEARKAGGRAGGGIKKPPHTEEWKQENSIRTKEWHANNEHPMLGKNHTDEVKTKISSSIKDIWDNTPEVMANTIVARKEGKSGKPRMTSERETAIIAAYKEGKTIAEIETQFTTGRSSIYRVLKRNNIEKTANYSKWEGKTHSDETKEKMSNARTEYWDNKK